MKLARTSKLQPHIELDVALEVQAPVNSAADLCDQDLFSHLYNWKTDGCWDHL